MGQLIYFQQAYLFDIYDVSYWRDRYEHSQYQLPLSRRVIGDDGLFAYAGYRVIQGDYPFSINIDKPPLGKYLIGSSIALFKNPVYYALFFGIGSLIVFYHVAKRFLEDSLLTFTITMLLFLDPLYFSQLWKSWLDISQLFFLLLTVLFFALLIEKKNHVFAFLSGLSLGFFIEIKPPILLPIIIIIQFSCILIQRLWKEYIVSILGLFLGLVLPYFLYLNFSQPLLILKLHKYMYSVYYHSQLKTNIGAIWQAVLFGNFPQISTAVPTRVSEWWIFWPVCIIIGLIFGARFIYSRKALLVWKSVYAFVFFSLVIFTFIPSYTRYLLMLLPFIYLLAGRVVKQYAGRRLKQSLFFIIAVTGLINTAFFLYPRPDNLLNTFYYNISNQYFQDIYQENMDLSDQSIMSRSKFRSIAQGALTKAAVKAIKIEEKQRHISLFANTGTVELVITYITQDVGSFSEKKTIDLVKRNQQWKIKWNWDIIVNDFKPSYDIETKVVLGKRGKIISRDGTILAEDRAGYLVSVNPEKIDTVREQEMLQFMATYGYKDSNNLQNEYLENSLPNTYVPLFTLHKIISDKEKNKLLSYPGVKLAEYPTRIYDGIDPLSIHSTLYTECCTRLYSSGNYHGVEGLEKKFDLLLYGYSGGKIILKDEKGDLVRVMHERKYQNGKDIILSK